MGPAPAGHADCDGLFRGGRPGDRGHRAAAEAGVAETPPAPAPPLVDTNAVSDEAPPLVIHLLFDGLLAPAAIRRDIAGGEAAYAAMQRLAARYGFRVFERAFSRHRYTAASIANMMNAEYQGRSDEPPSFAGETRIEENAYFDDYAARGYGIHVYQTSYLDFCAHDKVAACAEFDSYNPAWLIADRSYQDDGTGTFAAVRMRTLNLLLTLLHAHVKNYTGISWFAASSPRGRRWSPPRAMKNARYAPCGSDEPLRAGRGAHANG